MLSRTVEYALRAMVYLAGQVGQPCTSDQIATATQVPGPYLAKVLQSLGRGGLLRSQRGVNGGFSLASPPTDISVLDVVNAVDPLQRIHTCPLNLAAHGTNLCPLHRRLDNALAETERAFRESSLAEILAEPTDSIPLCDFPAGSGESTD